MSTESSPSARWLVPALVALAAAAAGLGAGWFLRGSSPDVRPAAGSLEPQAGGALPSAELEAAKREILARLEILGRARSASPSPATAPADDAVIELGRRIDEIDARLALISGGARTGAGPRDWGNARGPGSESLEKIFARIQEWQKREQKNIQQEDVREVLRKEHHLWMVEDIFRAYGPPEHVSSPNGLTFYYGRFQLAGDEVPCYICFRTLEGFVIEIDFECTDRW